MTTETQMPKSSDLHHAIARALNFALLNMRSMAAATMLDRATRDPGEDPLEVPAPVAELSTLMGTFVSAVCLCLRHDLLDQGAIETVWAEHLDEDTLRSHVKRIENLIAKVGEMEMNHG